MVDTYITIQGINPFLLLVLNSILGAIFSGIGVGIGVYLANKHILEKGSKLIKRMKKKWKKRAK